MDDGFSELDYCRTALGELVLRRRLERKLGVEVIEVKLGDEFLMSSLFTAGETALATLGMERLGPAFGHLDRNSLDIAVGGLGLGYTAAAVLAHDRVGSLLVIEALEPVIGWHRRGLVPLGEALCADARCELAHGDFFALAASAALDPRQPARRFHGIFVDIDHSSSQVLAPANASFYEVPGLRALARHLHPGGVFALWSDEAPDARLLRNLGEAFTDPEARVVQFPNPLVGAPSSCTIYLASHGARAIARASQR
jgi:spermidine synthase